jgi:hypothetical protein
MRAAIVAIVTAVSGVIVGRLVAVAIGCAEGRC